MLLVNLFLYKEFMGTNLYIKSIQCHFFKQLGKDILLC